MDMVGPLSNVPKCHLPECKVVIGFLSCLFFFFFFEIVSCGLIPHLKLHEYWPKRKEHS